MNAPEQLPLSTRGSAMSTLPPAVSPDRGSRRAKLPMRSSRTSTRRARRESGFTLAEVLVASTVGVIGLLIAVLLYQAARQVFKRGEQAANQQQETRAVFDKMFGEIRLAGYNWNASGETRLGEEPIEGAWSGAITIRGDYDFENVTLSHDPEDLIAGSTNKATVGNDEIVTYCLKKPDGSGGTNLTFAVDVDSSTTVTSLLYGAVSARDGGVETITIPGVVLTQDDPPYSLYRVTLNNAKASFGTSGFLKEELLAENVKSLQFTYLGVNGNALASPGGADDAATKAARAGIERINVKVVGVTELPDPDFVDAADPGPTRHHRKFDLTAVVTPRNQGLKGRADNDATAPSTPASLSICAGHCGGLVARWDPNDPAEDVTQYTIRHGTNPGALGNSRTTVGTFTYLSGLALGTTYYFAVRAIDASGNASEYSAEVAGVPVDATYPDHTVPERVSGLAGTGHGGVGAQNGRVALAWTPVTGNEIPLACDPGGNLARDLSGYRLYRSETDPFTPGPSSLVASETALSPGSASWTDTAVVNCRPYYYRLRAIDLSSCGNESPLEPSSHHAEARSTIPPAAPAQVSAERQGPTTAHLSWNPVTTDTSTPTPASVTIDKYRIWRTEIDAGLDPETAAYSEIATVQGATTFTDQPSPPITPGRRVYYKVSAFDDCPNESQRSTSGELVCFNGTVSIVPPSSPPNLDLGPRTVTVSAVGSDVYVQARLVITKTGGGVDLDVTQTVTGGAWTFPWGPGQGEGTYVAVATVTNSQGCEKTASVSWVVAVTACATCATIPAQNLDPDVPPRWYRQPNAIHNSCAFDLQIVNVKVRARSICNQGCTSPMKLLEVQYLPSGSFANETSGVVYTAAGTGDNVSTTQTAVVDLTSSPLVVPANSSSAKIRFVFSTATPIWVGNGSSRRSVLEGDFTFQQTSNLCSPSSLNNQRLD